MVSPFHIFNCYIFYAVGIWLCHNICFLSQITNTIIVLLVEHLLFFWVEYFIISLIFWVVLIRFKQHKQIHYFIWFEQRIHIHNYIYILGVGTHLVIAAACLLFYYSPRQRTSFICISLSMDWCSASNPRSPLERISLHIQTKDWNVRLIQFKIIHLPLKWGIGRDNPKYRHYHHHPKDGTSITDISLHIHKIWVNDGCMAW